MRSTLLNNKYLNDSRVVFVLPNPLDVVPDDAYRIFRMSEANHPPPHDNSVRSRSVKFYDGCGTTTVLGKRCGQKIVLQMLRCISDLK